MTKKIQNYLSNIKLKYRDTIFFFVKALISILILVFIFKKIDFAGFIRTFSKLRLSVFLQLLFWEIVREVFQLFNWRNYLMMNEIDVPLSKIFDTHFMGHAFRFLVPGGHGVYGKAFYMTGAKKKAAVAITIERFFQTWSILLFFGISLILLNVMTKGIVALELILLSLPFFLPYFITKLKFYSDNSSAHFKKYYSINIFFSIAAQIGTILIYIVEYFIIINNFVKVPFIKIFTSIPIILSSKIIPISYSGLGISEGFSMQAFKNSAVTPDIAVTASLTVFIISSLLPGILGLIIFLKIKKGSHKTAS